VGDNEDEDCDDEAYLELQQYLKRVHLAGIRNLRPHALIAQGRIHWKHKVRLMPHTLVA
jgi:hypothetical protein